MYIVIIEWDGKTPPNTFYSRMHKLGLFVRGGDKELSPLQRRAQEDGSVIAQEGAILCASESLARTIANRAQWDGAAMVKIGMLDPVDFHATPLDKAVMERIENIHGRIGRPTGEKVDWTVTCFEECKSYLVRDEYAVANCPYCSGTNVRTRVGEVIRWKLPEGDIFNAWLRTRFSSGVLVVPDKGDRLPPRSVEISHALEHAYVEIMRNSTEFMDMIQALPRQTAVSVLDAVLASRAHRNQETRQYHRIEACTELFQKGIDPTAVSLHEPVKEVDLMDAAPVIGSSETASLWLAISKSQ